MKGVNTMESKQRRLYAIVAGVCFILLGIYESYETIEEISILLDVNCDISVIDIFSCLFVFLRAVCSLALGVLWTISTKRFTFWIVMYAYCIVHIISYINSLWSILDNVRYFSLDLTSFEYILGCCIQIVLFFSFLFVTVGVYTSNPMSQVKEIAYFVPLILRGVNFVITFVVNIIDGIHLTSFILFILYEMLILLALLMGGLWLKGYGTTESKKKAPAPAAPLIGLAERLQQYKDLLDAGVLTQAEFDAKKAEILHL